MWCVAALIVRFRFGSKTRMSASEPTAIAPFWGYIPKSRAGVVDMISTHRSRVIRPSTTPK